MTPLVIFHADCNDGFCAALIARRFLPDAEFVPAQYGQPPVSMEDVAGRQVFILDFSYPRETLLAIHGRAELLVVLDHHKTAHEALDGLSFCAFDINKSGARLTAEYFCPDVQVFGWIVDYTEDRDLWRWKLPNSREINAALASYPRNFKVWEELYIKRTPEDLAVEGAAILRYQSTVIASHVKNAGKAMVAGCVVMAVNSTVLISEIAGELANGYPFGCCYFDTADGKRVFSLRSTPEGTDVSEVAKLYGGGGHKHAAGFTISAKVLSSFVQADGTELPVLA